MQQVPPPEIERRNGAVNGSNGANGNHVIPVTPMMVPMPVPAPSKDDGGLDMSAIWNAFRRRWFLAIGLGLLFGIPAAIGAWIYAPAPFVAFAELRLNSINTQSFPGSNSGRIPDFANRKQAVLKRASHPMLLMEALRNPDVQTAAMIREQEPHVIPWLEENLTIKSVGEEYIRIELEGENPKELAVVVNSVSESLIVDVEQDMNRDRTKRQNNLNSLITEATNSIATKTTELENLRNVLKVDPAEIERRQSYLIELSASLRSALVTIELERLKYQGQAPEMPANGKLPQQQIESLIDTVAVTDSRCQRAVEEVSRQNKRITDQERYVRQQTDALDETHPDRVAAKEKLLNLREELKELSAEESRVREVIKQEVLANLPEEAQKATDPDVWFKTHQDIFEKAFEANEKKLTAELEEIKAEREYLAQFSLRGSRITREIEGEQKKLDAYKSEAEKLKYEIENTPTMIQESRRADVPHTRSLKKKTMLTGVAGLGVFGFFVAGIVFLEFRMQRIATLNQVSEKLNLRVMGTVPLLPQSAATGSSVKKKAKNALWYSALTEAIDSTRTLLIRGSQIEQLKTVMIASAMGGEGKTTMASHLATSLARGGRKILLIDCDLRRPCMHRAFDLPMSQGVCEILRGEADVADCIQELESPSGLSVLCAGKINQQVLKLLALDSFPEMLEPLKQQFDFIIIDSSPLLPVTDALLVAQHVDGVILSIRRDVSRIGKVVMACQKMGMLGVPLLGAVTIGLQEESGYQVKYGYNYYGYGHRQNYYTQSPPI